MRIELRATGGARARSATPTATGASTSSPGTDPTRSRLREELDTNGDGKVDFRRAYADGAISGEEEDKDFDGRFELVTRFAGGVPVAPSRTATATASRT